MEKEQQEKLQALVDGEAQSVKEAAAKKEEIRRELQPYVDEGLLREIGSTELLIVYNVSDKYYVIAPGVKDKKYGYQVGILAYPKVVKRILKNEEYFARYVRFIRSQSTMYLGPNNLEAMRRWKRETDEQGPKYIDVPFEQELGVRPATEGGDATKATEPSKKRSIFFWKK
ncbi:MAG: hypothetical protein IJU25_04445 [Lachnospiraceae bacterium]|nr:hypothetical protein [Lachnospiraceae bacterium]